LIVAHLEWPDMERPRIRNDCYRYPTLPSEHSKTGLRRRAQTTLGKSWL